MTSPIFQPEEPISLRAICEQIMDWAARASRSGIDETLEIKLYSMSNGQLNQVDWKPGSTFRRKVSKADGD